MSISARLMGIPAEKEQLIRSLLADRLRALPEASIQPQIVREAQRVSAARLLSQPEATIVVCVESWAKMRSQGQNEAAIAQAIARLRRVKVPCSSILEAIHHAAMDTIAGNGNSYRLDPKHFALCISKSASLYGLAVAHQLRTYLGTDEPPPRPAAASPPPRTAASAPPPRPAAPIIDVVRCSCGQRLRVDRAQVARASCPKCKSTL